MAKPWDESLLHDIGKRFKKVITVEDGAIKGGFGSGVLEFFDANGYNSSVKMIGIGDAFVGHGTPAELYEACGMDEAGIYRTITAG